MTMIITQKDPQQSKQNKTKNLPARVAFRARSLKKFASVEFGFKPRSSASKYDFD